MWRRLYCTWMCYNTMVWCDIRIVVWIGYSRVLTQPIPRSHVGLARHLACRTLEITFSTRTWLTNTHHHRYENYLNTTVCTALHIACKLPYTVYRILHAEIGGFHTYSTKYSNTSVRGVYSSPWSFFLSYVELWIILRDLGVKRAKGIGAKCWENWRRGPRSLAKFRSYLSVI
jgi:hypothetical protein